MQCKVCNQTINEFNFNDFFGIKKHVLCYKCFNELSLINEVTTIENFKCFSIYLYKDKIKDLIYQFKVLKDYELKDVFLEYFLEELNYKYRKYIITFVPSYHLDDTNRGFNHVEAMFSSLKNKKICLFKKTINHKQSDQKLYNRTKIKDYIYLDKSKLRGIKKVLIVDDILTTGNTLKSCAKLLTNEGIKDIQLLTICKASNYK